GRGQGHRVLGGAVDLDRRLRGRGAAGDVLGRQAEAVEAVGQRRGVQLGQRAAGDGLFAARDLRELVGIEARDLQCPEVEVTVLDGADDAGEGGDGGAQRGRVEGDR